MFDEGYLPRRINRNRKRSYGLPIIFALTLILAGATFSVAFVVWGLPEPNRPTAEQPEDSTSTQPQSAQQPSSPRDNNAGVLGSLNPLWPKQ